MQSDPCRTDSKMYFPRQCGIGSISLTNIVTLDRTAIEEKVKSSCQQDLKIELIWTQTLLFLETRGQGWKGVWWGKVELVGPTRSGEWEIQGPGWVERELELGRAKPGGWV